MLEDSEKVSLLPSQHLKTKTKMKMSKNKEMKKKRRDNKCNSPVSVGENFINTEEFEDLLGNGDGDSDKMPLLPKSRAVVKKQRQAEARRLRRQRRKVCPYC